MQRNQKGFTLIEILVALSLLVLVVFCFTPLMLSSLQNVQMAGEQRETTYQEKASLEESLAEGIDYTKPLPDDQVAVVFKQGDITRASMSKGKILHSGENLMTGYVALDTGEMTLSPSFVGESYTAGTEIGIECALIPFADKNLFTLTDKNGTKLTAPNVEFSLTLKPGETTSKKAVLKIKAAGLLSMSQSPYTITYDDGLYATLTVTPPNLIALGSNGAYYVKRGDTWQKVTSPFTQTTMRDVVWTGVQFVAGGDNAWYYTTDSGWSNRVELKKDPSILDVHISPATGEIYNAGYYMTTSFFVKYPEAYFEHRDAAQKFVGGEKEWLANNTTGTATTSGYYNDSEQFLHAYYSEKKFLSGTEACYINLGDREVFNLPRSDTYITGMDWNSRTGADCEYLAVLNDGKIYHYLPGVQSNAFVDNGNVTAEAARRPNPDKPTESYFTYTVKDANGNAMVVRDYPEIPSENPRPVTYNSSGKTYTVKLITEQGGTEATYTLNRPNATTVCAQKLSDVSYYIQDSMTIEASPNDTNGFRSVAFGGDTWVAVGNEISVKVENAYTKSYSSTTYTVQNKANTWTAGSTTVVPNEQDTDYAAGNTNTKAKIMYREADDFDAGRWKIAEVPTTGVGNLMKVSYIGNRFYAVGSNGTILVSEDNGRTWKHEKKATGLTDTLYGVAGFGDE